MCSQLELDSHANTIVWLQLHPTSLHKKERALTPCTDVCEAIRGVLIVQAATVHDNPKTGEHALLTLNEAIWMGEQMDHTSVNPNQLCTC
jgi:hypothetical protein